jgi:predicted HTH domain antitoxin
MDDLLHRKTQLIIDYPKSWLDALQQTQTSFEFEAKMAMTVKLFEMKRISSGMAAQLVDMDRLSFLMNLHRFGVARIDLDEDELQSDVDNG